VTAKSDTRYVGNIAPLIAVALVLLMMATLLAGPAGGGIPVDRPDVVDGPAAIPSDFRGHRPLLEMFTGLSCPSCMSGPHPETEEMYANIRDDESVPWTYVSFHELNGGGEDGLANEDSRARMRHYQPGISGTPAIEVDGGWHTLGGFYGVDSISTSNNQAALDAASDRYQRSFDPRHPLQVIRNDFKFVNLEVSQHLDGDMWVVMVNVHYLGMDRLVLQEDLRGSLYVFMVEDDVTAWSAVEEDYVLNHNVFRGYAINGRDVTLSPGDEMTLAGEWPIPEIVVDPDEEYPEGTPVPIKSMDVTAVAAVFDLDDTSSGDGVNGNPNPVPRCIQSATPQSTAYDLDNVAEPVGDVKVTEKGTTLTFEASIDDPDGVASAAVHFTTEGANGTYWTPLTLELTGEEVCDDEGVCYAYADASATAEYELDEPVGEIWYVVTYSDGLGAMGKTEVLYTEVNAAVAAGGGEMSLSGGTVILIIMVLILVALGVLLYMRREDRTQRQAIAAVMVLVLIIGGVFAMSAGGSGGTEAPDIAFTDLDGDDVSISDFKGKVVVLDMMATWCPSCREGMADLVEVNDRYGDSIEMITIDIDLTETPAQLRDYQREYEADWRFAMDNEAQDFLTEFNVKTIPKIVVIDIHGDVVFSESVVISADDLSDIIDDAQTGGASAISINSAGGSMGALVLWAGALGVLTFFSPCSFPMLPGYMTYYLGLRDSRNQRKAIMGGIAAAAGIVLLFLGVAILVGIFGSAISQYVVYLEPVLGVMLVIMALLILLDININFGLLTWPIKKGMAFSKRTLDKVRGKEKAEGEGKVVKDIEEGGYVGLFLYGVGYGAAAAGCMAPVVIALILLAASQGSFLASVGIFLVFSLAMALLMVVITVALGHYGNDALKKMRVNPQTVKVLSSLVLLVVGVYLIAYYVGGLA
jgi:cytochrome c biogenesis protein CcdA/cytochrome oxidase Cu insertion factor (SCO1/SenC/PrrC family)